MIANLVRDGAPQDVIDRFAAGEEQEGEGFDVWPENWRAVQLFVAAQDRWIYAGMAGAPMAFDVMAADLVWRSLGQKLKPSVFARVKTVADAALREMQAILAKQAPKAPARPAHE